METNEDAGVKSSPLEMQSSLIQSSLDGPSRDGKAVYSNISFSGGIYNREAAGKNEPPPISYWRQAELTDIPKIERLITEYSIQVFGQIDLPYIIETSFVCLVQINEASEIILFFAFSKNCQLPGIPASATTDFLMLYYGIEYAKLPGTYMARLLLYDERYTGDTLRYLLRSLFNSQQEVSFVLLILPGRLPASAGEEGIRDTSSIFKHHTEAIQQKYGSFSLKELIENPESRIVTYSEVKYRGKTRPAAITVLNSEVNIELINSNFETLTFYGFKVPHTKDVIEINGWDETIASPAHSQENLKVDEEKKSDMEEEDEDVKQIKETRWAREARLAAEEVERRRRRLHSADHYLSQLSLTQDELNEPDDPFHVADAQWDQLVDDNLPDGATNGAAVNTKIKKIRKKGKRSSVHIFRKYEKNIQEYHGTGNAFIIELILTHPDFGDRLGSSYLRELFQVYSHLDYCLLTLPHAYPDFPLLKYFTRMTPRPGKNFPHDVYVLHRSVVVGKPGVREGRPGDLPFLKHMARTLKRGRAAMLNELRHAFGPDAPRWLRPFVFTLGEEIIGAAIIASIPARRTGCHQPSSVGIRLIRHTKSEEDDVPSLLAHYEVNRHTNAYIYSREEFACLRVGLMSPIFRKFGAYFLREIMRLADIGVLFHPVFPFTEESLAKNDEIPDGPEVCPTLLAMEMVPVMPRPYLDVKYDVCPNFAGDTKEVLKAALKRTTPCALFLTTPRMTLLGKRMINLQIVVVGASETGLGFLQNLIFSPTNEVTRYTSLTLITKAPLPHWAASPLIDAFRPFMGRLSRGFIASIGFSIWVNIVIGSVRTIDRENKVVTTTGDAKIPYDLLFLFPGEQFSQPYLYRESTGDRCRHYIMNTPGLVSEDTPGREVDEEDEQPVNAFYINSEADIINALTRLAHGIGMSPKYTIILYGHKVDLYICLSGLLSWGVPGENIVVVLDRTPSQEENVFFDDEIMEKVEMCMQDEGITLYVGWAMRSWQVEDLDLVSSWPEPHIINVTFWPQPGAKIVRRDENTGRVVDMGNGPISVNCLGLFCFSYKTIDRDLLDAIFEAGLVFDGRLVVDRQGSTNDPRIKAAGPVTRLSRRIPHARDSTLYCSIEHGYKMAQRMRHIWDPLERDHIYIRSIPTPSSPLIDTEELKMHPHAAQYGIEPPHRSKMALAIRAALGPFVKYSSLHPSFIYPSIISCNLPGGWYYTLLQSPGKMSSKKKIKEYRTGECESGKGPYCRVIIGPGNLINCICILSETPQPRRSIIELYGHHVDTVGPLENSTNLLATLLRPTVIAQTVGRRTGEGNVCDFEVLNSYPHRVLLTTVEKVLQNNDWKELNSGQIKELRRQFLNSPQQKRLEDRLQTYLEAHGLTLEPGEVELYLKAILYYTPG